MEPPTIVPVRLFVFLGTKTASLEEPSRSRHGVSRPRPLVPRGHQDFHGRLLQRAHGLLPAPVVFRQGRQGPLGAQQVAKRRARAPLARAEDGPKAEGEGIGAGAGITGDRGQGLIEARLGVSRLVPKPMDLAPHRPQERRLLGGAHMAHDVGRADVALHGLVEAIALVGDEAEEAERRPFEPRAPAVRGEPPGRQKVLLRVGQLAELLLAPTEVEQGARRLTIEVRTTRQLHDLLEHGQPAGGVPAADGDEGEPREGTGNDPEPTRVSTAIARALEVFVRKVRRADLQEHPTETLLGVPLDGRRVDAPCQGQGRLEVSPRERQLPRVLMELAASHLRLHAREGRIAVFAARRGQCLVQHGDGTLGRTALDHGDADGRGDEEGAPPRPAGRHVIERSAVGGDEVVELREELGARRRFPGLVDDLEGLPREGRTVVAVTVHRAARARWIVGELPPGEVADAPEHAKARAVLGTCRGHGQQGAVAQRLNAVERLLLADLCDGTDRVQIERAAEQRAALHHPPLRLVEQTEGPGDGVVDGGARRALLLEPRTQLAEPHAPDPRRHELDGERQAVEQAAYRHRILEPVLRGLGAEGVRHPRPQEPHRGRCQGRFLGAPKREGWEIDDPFPGHAEAPSRGDEDAEPRCARQPASEDATNGRAERLGAVQDQQHRIPERQHRAHAVDAGVVGGARHLEIERVADLVHDRLGVPRIAEVHEPDLSRGVLEERAAELEGEPRLSAPRRAEDRHEAAAARELSLQTAQQAVPADEARQRGREVCPATGGSGHASDATPPRKQVQPEAGDRSRGARDRQAGIAATTAVVLCQPWSLPV